MKRLVSVSLSFVFVMMVCGLVFAECDGFIASKASNKYHMADCSIAKDIQADDEVCFKTQEEALKAGYAPCDICKPEEKIRVVGSKDSDTYHLLTCDLVKKIKPENLVEYSSPLEAVKLDRLPCEICKPPKPKINYIKYGRED